MTIRFGLYAVICLCFGVAGVLDLYDGNTKLGVVALFFALVNAIIFFWKN